MSNLLLAAGEGQDAEALIVRRQSRRSWASCRLHASRERPGARCIVVSNEVGLGVVPPTPLGRAYRDALGRANQLVAAAADDVRLLVAGLELPLKSTR